MQQTSLPKTKEAQLGEEAAEEGVAKKRLVLTSGSFKSSPENPAILLDLGENGHFETVWQQQPSWRYIRKRTGAELLFIVAELQRMMAAIEPTVGLTLAMHIQSGW